MHVAFNGYFWDQPRTGSGQYLRHLWGALNDSSLLPGRHAAAPDTVTMLLPPGHRQPSSPDDAVPAGLHSRVVFGRPMPVAGGSSDNLDKLYWEQWEVARTAVRERAQILHVPYLAAPAPLPGVKRCPVVVTAHDMIPWVVPGYAGSPAARLYFALAASSVRRADVVLADSEASRRDVITVLHVPAGRVKTVYLGMEPHPPYSRHDLDEVRARHDLPGSYGFYLGGFDARKNVPLLLQAWRSIVDSIGSETGETPLLAIGGAIPEPGGIFPDIMKEAEHIGLLGPDASVRFLGRVSEADKPLLMAAARIFVYPSAYEGFGLDPLEAMSVGCPVVSSSGGSLKEVVGDAGLLVPPGDVLALAEAISCAWRDPSLRSSLSGKGRERAGQFTWERTAAQTRQLYSTILARRKSHAGRPRNNL